MGGGGGLEFFGRGEEGGGLKQFFFRIFFTGCVRKIVGLKLDFFLSMSNALSDFFPILVVT